MRYLVLFFVLVGVSRVLAGDEISSPALNVSSAAPTIAPTPTPTNEPSNSPIEEIVIVAYHAGSWAGITEDVWEAPNYVGHTVKKDRCPVPCTVTYDHEAAAWADGILMEAAHWGANYEWRRTAPQFLEKRSWQKWIELAYEQPNYFPFTTESEWHNRVDINMTYHQDSHVPVTFLCSWGGGTMEDYARAPLPYDNKTGSIAWVNSNCGGGGAAFRTAYVKELMKYIAVDAMGGCLHNKDMPQHATAHPFFGPEKFGGGMRQKQSVFSTYKIVLAFENNNVTDYVTEKLWNAVVSGALPVYMGAPNIDEWLPGPRSIIKTSDFGSPRELAEYLQKVLADRALYDSYFEWKKNGLSANFTERYRRCMFYGSECRLCQYLSKLPRTPQQTKLREIARKAKVADPHMRDAYALLLDGSKQYIEVRSPLLNFNSDFSILAWATASSFGDNRIVDKNEASKVRGYGMDVLYEQQLKRAYFRVHACRDYFLGYHKMQTDTWYHYAMVVSYSKGFIRLYINSKLDSEFACEYPTTVNDLPFTVGRIAHGGGSYWPGRIDDVTVFNRAISEKEIFDMMLTRRDGTEEGLVLYFSFNDKNAAAATDFGPNGLNGTFARPPTYVDNTERPMAISPCY